MARHLTFAPDVLARLGEELVPHPDLGVIELVRNAYDADAPCCHVWLTDAASPGGTLIVADSGSGMSEQDIYESFLLVGKSSKTVKPQTANGRRKVGEKGLGRLAALRLGTQVELATRPKEDPGVEHVLTIDWSKYSDVRTVEEVPLNVETRKTDEPSGTTVTVKNLRQAFTEKDVERMARALLLLTGPFPGDSEFRAHLHAPEFSRLAKMLRNGFLTEHDFLLDATLDEEGLAKATLYDWRGEVIEKASHDIVAQDRRRGGRRDVPIKFDAPPARLQLWMFRLSREAFTRRGSETDVEQVRQWLREVGGVHLYHRGLRVHPYGDPGHDWLELNARRTGSPEERPSTSTSVGRMVVDDEGQLLQPKTDRVGFVETLAFTELREFGKRVTDWAAHERLQRAEKERRAKTPTTRARMRSAESDLRKAIKKLPPQYQAVVEPAALNYSTETKQHVKAVESDLRLYRMLSTLGTSTAVFAHEVLGPAGRLARMLGVIGRRIKTHVGDDTFDASFAEPMSRVERTVGSVQAFAGLSLEMIQKHKREISNVNVDAVCADVVNLFSQYLEERNIAVTTDLDSSSVYIRTAVADLEAIYANLLTNSAHALLRSDAPDRPRQIHIRSRVAGTRVQISVDDSGPGIHDLPISEIWLPGRSSRTDGTGLGLTIVKDVVTDLRGTCDAAAEGSLGGAHFLVRIPYSGQASEASRGATNHG
ncbi:MULTISPECIES: ATP-binding protein [unclassified Streptomyces]|uniref:ATP-binding protein n=1 Tax=unclassified Streptomyces TaxID=2593676 RepID=UPI0036FBAE21